MSLVEIKMRADAGELQENLDLLFMVKMYKNLNYFQSKNLNDRTLLLPLKPLNVMFAWMVEVSCSVYRISVVRRTIICLA